MAGPSPKPKVKEEAPVFSTENICLYLDPSNAETLSQQLKKEGYVVIFRTFLTDSGPKNVLIANKQGVTEDQLMEILNKVGVILPSPSKQVIPQKEFREAQKRAKELEPEIKEERKKVNELPKIIAKLKDEEEAKKKAQEEAKKKAAEEQKKKAEEEAKRKAEEEAKKKAEEEAKKKEPQKREKKEEPAKPAPKKEAPQEEKPQEPSKTQTRPDGRLGPSEPSGPIKIDLAQQSQVNLEGIKPGVGEVKSPNLEISLGEKKGEKETGKIVEHESKIIRIKEYKGKPALYMWGSITTGSSKEDKVIYRDREKLKGDEKNVVPIIQENIKGKSILYGYLVFGINYLRANSDENGHLTQDAKKKILDEIRDHIGIKNPDRLKEIEKYILDKIHVNK